MARQYVEYINGSIFLNGGHFLMYVDAPLTEFECACEIQSHRSLGFSRAHQTILLINLCPNVQLVEEEAVLDVVSVSSHINQVRARTLNECARPLSCHTAHTSRQVMQFVQIWTGPLSLSLKHRANRCSVRAL